MSKPINTCVCGVGLAGLAFHVPFILALPELFNLQSVLERSPSSPQGKVHERFGVATKIHRSLNSVLADADVELVIIGTPNETHHSFAKAALQAGKHVLVDKPVTSNVEEGKELYELAQSKNLVLYPFQNRRWDSDFIALKKLLALPESSPQSLGDLVEFESRLDRFRNALKGTWKDDPLPAAGQTFDLGSHLMDQTLALFGRPAKLTAFIQNVRRLGNLGVDDTFTIFLQYPEGNPSKYPFTVILRGHILSVKDSQLRYVVRGTKGTFTKYGVDVQEDQLKAIKGPSDIFEQGFGKETEATWGTLENLTDDSSGGVAISKWPSEEPGSYVELFKNLARVIRREEEQQIKWLDAVSVIELIQIAHKSSKEGVTISL